MVDTDEQRDLRQLISWLERIEPWQKLTGQDSRAWQADPRSSLAGDDAKTDPFQMSHSVWHALTVSVDHLGCLRSSLLGDLQGERREVRIHTHAQSSLLRGAIENAARAVWLLGPKDRPTRVSRRLALQAKETKDFFRMRALTQQPTVQTQQERLQRLTDLLITAGLSERQAKATVKTPPRYTEIVRGAGELTTLGADLAQLVWSGCSALAHGDAYGTLAMLDKEIMVRSQDVSLVRITGSISGLYWCTVAAVLLVQQGFELLQARSISYR
ncbi:hypothetical protein ACFY19_00785 [Streptosporangium saharense]|uniref:hypothetical protein n=1 Tax=Streptosporangium saharense TaxID=1706840 RepID=UPI0036ADAE75